MKKRILLTSALVLCLGVSGGALALRGSSNHDIASAQIKDVSSVDISKDSAPTAATPTLQTKVDSIASPTQTQPAPQQTSSSVQSTDTPAPIYGEDPNLPGVYVVFDHQSVMDSAGIAADQQSAAEILITHLMNWRYKLDANANANICYVDPITKMASAGADYRTNPITQLKWCDAYAINRYGSWQKALEVYNQTYSFGIFD